MNINDIIGKSWLLNLENSEGYVLSFKLIDQNSSSSVSSETEQEEKTTAKELKFTQKEKLSYNPQQSQLVKYLQDYFLKEKAKFQPFVKEVNDKMAHLNIPKIKYEELKTSNDVNINKKTQENSLISGKIKDLVWKFGSANELSSLERIFENFKNSN